MAMNKKDEREKKGHTVRKKRVNAVNSLIVLALILSMLLTACSAPTASQPTSLPATTPIPADTLVPPTETPLPSPTPDIRPRLLTTDNGAVLRPETEINDTNFQQLKLLGTLGSGNPTVVQFSPDDTLLAVGTSLGEIHIYAAQSLDLIYTIQTELLLQFPKDFYGQTCTPCGRLAFSPDNKLLGVLSVEGNIQIWNLESQKQIASSTESFIAETMQKRLAGENVRLTNWRYLQFSDDSSYLGILLEPIWWPPNYCPLSSAQCKKNYKTSFFILSVSGSVWCDKFVCPTSSSAEIQNDLSQFNDAFTFAPDDLKIPPIPLPKEINEKTDYRGTSYIKPQYISLDGSQALSFDLYGVANNFARYGNSEVIYAGTLWDVLNNKLINNFSFPYIETYSFSHDLKTIAYATPSGITVLDIPSGDTNEISLGTCPGNLIFSPDGKVLVGYYTSAIYFCDPLTGEISRTISVPTGFISSIAFSPDGKFVASTGQTWGNYLSASKKNYDPYVYIWNVSDGQLVTTLEHEGDTIIVKFSPDGKYIAIGAGIDRACAGVTSPKDERFLLWTWDGRTATEIKKQKFDTGISSLAFSPNSQQILVATNEACANKNPRIYLYDILNDIFSQTYYRINGGATLEFLQFLRDDKEFVYSAFSDIGLVSISTNSNSPEFSTSNIPIEGGTQNSNISVAPNSLVYVIPSSKQIQLGSLTSFDQTKISGKFIYINSVFSPDGSVIYGRANLLGVISVWGIPEAK